MIEIQFVEASAAPSNYWMEPTVQNRTALAEEEQGQRYFALRLILVRRLWRFS